MHFGRAFREITRRRRRLLPKIEPPVCSLAPAEAAERARFTMRRRAQGKPNFIMLSSESIGTDRRQ
jgi:hypothetical protein